MLETETEELRIVQEEPKLPPTAQVPTLTARSGRANTGSQSIRIQ